MVRKEKPTKFATASRRKIEHNLETIVLNRIKHQQTKVPLGRKKLPAGKGKHIKKKNYLHLAKFMRQIQEKNNKKRQTKTFLWKMKTVLGKQLLGTFKEIKRN